MTPTFEDSTAHVRQKLEKLSRDYRKAIGANPFTRRWRVFKTRYDTNPVFKDVIDCIWVSVILGLICAIIFGISIVEYLNPHL